MSPVFFGTKKKGKAMGDFDGRILPVFRFSSINFCIFSYSLGDKG
jgi:hypothetical protein